MMIDVHQWRAAIGTFAGGKRNTTFDSSRKIKVISTSWYGVITTSGLLLCSYSLLIVAVLLICCGDIEVNPGPVNYKKCPICLTILWNMFWFLVLSSCSVTHDLTN